MLLPEDYTIRVSVVTVTFLKQSLIAPAFVKPKPTLTLINYSNYNNRVLVYHYTSSSKQKKVMSMIFILLTVDS